MLHKFTSGQFMACESSPCNHGKGIGTVNDYICDCDASFHGLQCDGRLLCLIVVIFHHTYQITYSFATNLAKTQ